MCGIAFWSKAATGSEIPDARKLAKALLEEIEVRGRMAAGVAWHGPTNQIWWQKGAMTGSRLGQQLKLSPGSPQGILHTRFATKGSPSVNSNNHPIVRPGIVLVHNGMVSNDDEVFKTSKMKRVAQVDSEAIAVALMENTYNDALAMVHGSVAVAWMEVTEEDAPNEPVLHVARCSSSPVVIAQTEAGDLIGASTLQAIKNACQKCKITIVWHTELDEWTHLTIREGVIVNWEEMPEPEWSRNYVQQHWASNSYVSSKSGTRYIYGSKSYDEDFTPKPLKTAAEIIRESEQFDKDRARFLRQERLAANDQLELDEWWDEKDAAEPTDEELFGDPDVIDDEDLNALLQWHADNDWRTK